MIITISSPEQIDELLASGCGQSFSSEVGMAGDFKPEVFKKNWLEFMRLNIGRIWTLDLGGKIAGAIGGLCYPDVNSGEPRSTEMFWYILPEHRGGMGFIRLFEALEKWALELGSKYHSMIRHHATMDERLEEFYTRRGYLKAETLFTKNF